MMLLKPRLRLRHVTRDSQQFINVGLESNPADAERTLNGYKLNKRRTIDRKEQYAHAMDAFGRNGFPRSNATRTSRQRARSRRKLGLYMTRCCSSWKVRCPSLTKSRIPEVQRDVLHLLLDQIIPAERLVTEKEKELGSGFFVLAQTFPSPAGAGLTVLARVELPRTAELHFPVLDSLSTAHSSRPERSQSSCPIFAKVLARGLGFARY